MRTIVSLILAGALAAPAFADNKKELQALAGKWQATSMEFGGRKSPDDQVKNITLTIDGDKYTVPITAEATDKGTIKLDKKDKLKTMDITGTDGPNKGKTILAIYELEGDSLKVCYALDGDKRPTEFKAGEGKLLLITYKRVNK
ncbi:MAG: TIGR03067 domain-containing protein [Gemmataceae bacterium]